MANPFGVLSGRGDRARRPRVRLRQPWAMLDIPFGEMMGRAAVVR